MAEQYSQAGLQLGRFDRSANVPTGKATVDMSEANKWQGLADAIGMFADKGGKAYVAKLNREKRDEAKRRADEAYARQEKNRKENEAKIEAERLYALHGDKNWDELTEAEKEEQINIPESWRTHAGADTGTVKFKVLKDEQAQDEFLKNAYQQKRTEGVLKKQQADWDAVAPNLVDNIYQEWKDQRNNKDPETGQQIGETDFTKYATAKLEIIKLERAQEHFIGLPQLGEALKNVPINDDKYLSMVAKRKQQHVDELQDKNIQSAIDTHLIGESPITDLGNPDSIDALIEHISELGPKGSKLTGPDGKVLRVHSRDKVQFQLIDDIESKLTNATSSDDPVFKIIDSFSGENRKHKKGGIRMMERRRGVGDAWKKVYGNALKKKSELIKDEKTRNKANLKIENDRAKSSAHNSLINSSRALDYQTIRPEDEGEGAVFQDGKFKGKLNRLQQLQIALSHLDANQKDFKTAHMSKEFNDRRKELVAAIHKLNPKHEDFDISKDPEAKLLEKQFIAELSKADVATVIKIRTAHQQNLDQTPAIVNMKNKAIENRLKQLDEEREIQKDQDTIAKSKQLLETNKIKQTSGEKSRSYRAQVRNEEGKILSSDELLKKLQVIENDKNITKEDFNTLYELYNTRIKEQQKTEHIKRDTTKHSSLFTKITSKGKDGKLLTPKDWNDLEKELNSHTWIEGSPQKTQLLTLISAGRNKTGDFDRQVADLKKENKYRTKLSNKLKPVEKNLADIIGKVSLPEGTKGRITVETALDELKKAREKFDNNFAEIIKEGGDLGINIDHDDRFEDAYAEILGQRTEKEISNKKKTWLEEHEKNEISREAFKGEQLTSIRELIENPLVNKNGERIEPTDALANLQDILANSTHSKTSKEVGVTLGETNVFSADDINKHIRKLQVSIKEKTDPSKFVSKASVILESYTMQQEARELSGEDKWLKIQENIELIEQEYLLGNLSQKDFNKERSLIKSLQGEGKVKTKEPLAAGENHIKSLFAGYLNKFNNNKMLLPVNEDGKLYDTLVQDFNYAWAGLAEELKDNTPQERLAAAVKLARSYTKVYANDKDHPIDPETNQRLKEYQMDTLKLLQLRKKQREDQRKQEVKDASKNTQKTIDKTKTDKKNTETHELSDEAKKSSIYQDLENDTTSYIINPAKGTYSIITTKQENPQGWFGITMDKLSDGLWNNEKETYVTISEPYDISSATL
ncbi:MAG: hypothetical protein Unbinned202contig1000_3 [Prokaryotic dsDNA virus sp.]|nr:MAG: hypothetical protein Unbinned202contig1000_3 [Prokaryotic dsDNA virus sp.]|tara:strand:- start:6151 stop:9771 length:3621 start_codon:yes stop_codon:yes gene_type:complete